MATKPVLLKPLSGFMAGSLHAPADSAPPATLTMASSRTLRLALVCLIPAVSEGLTIFRFGGAALPPPDDAAEPGVTFVSLAWSDEDENSRGQSHRIITGSSLAPRHFDGHVNLAPAAMRRLESEGEIRFGAAAAALDADLVTSWLVEAYNCLSYGDRVRSILCDQDGYSRRAQVWLDLGGQFLLRRIRVLSGYTDPARIARDFRILVFPALPAVEVFTEETASGGTLFRTPGWALPHEILVTDNELWDREVEIPREFRRAASFSVSLGEHTHPWEVAEIEAYALGVAGSARYTSRLLDMEGPAVWGEMRWAGMEGADARVFLQTRLGKDDTPLAYWRYTGRLDEKRTVSREVYNSLAVGEVAGTTYDIGNWSFWSSPYVFADSAGAQIFSGDPRRFLQVRADFVSRGEVGSRLDYLEIRATRPPLATALAAEVWPSRADAGAPSRFTYALKPTLLGSDSGFDRLEISSVGLIGAVLDLRIAGLTVPYTLDGRDEHRFILTIPRIGLADSGALLEVDFEAQVLRDGSSFDGRVFDSSRPLEVPQVVTAGDAAAEFGANTTSVETSVKAEPVLTARLARKGLTPNGDGVNETATLHIGLFEIVSPVRVVVWISDLGGRRARKLADFSAAIGRHEVTWDGRDDAGSLLPPGLYLYRVEAATDRGRITEDGTICLIH